MPKINIMFSSRPKLLSDIIRNLIECQPDMIVVGEVLDPIELILELRVTPADVVIITPHKANGAPKICGQLLKEHPQLIIIILTAESEDAYIFQSGLQRKHVERPSQQLILDTIRKFEQPSFIMNKDLN